MKLFNRWKSNKKGFTLLELLVVIGLIGILVGLGATSYSTAQKKARDAKRKGDLMAVKNCLEQYYTYNNNLKYSGAGITSAGALPASVSCGATSLTSPADPLNSGSYVYSVVTAPAVGAESFDIKAKMETETNDYHVYNQQ